MLVEKRQQYFIFAEFDCQLVWSLKDKSASYVCFCTFYDQQLHVQSFYMHVSCRAACVVELCYMEGLYYVNGLSD